MSLEALLTLAGQVLGEVAGRAAPDSAVAALEGARDLGRVLDVGEAALAVLVARVDSSGACRQEGYPATVSWLRTELGMAHGRAGERVVLARHLPRLDHTSTLLATGRLSAAYAREICTAVQRLDQTDTLVAEDILLGMVESGAGVREVARAATRITDLIRQQRGLEPEPDDGRRSERRSWLRRSRSLQGGSFIQGWLSALDEAAFTAIVDPLTKPADQHDPRDTPERTADALMTILTRGGRTSAVTVIADLAALNTDTDTPSPAPQPNGDHSTQPPTPGKQTPAGRTGARLLNQTPLSPAQARRIALAGGINLLLLGKHGHPLYLGRRVRFASAAQRRVLETLYATCAVKGCDIPAHLCEIHHLGGGWKFGTPTNINHLVPACRFHNAWIEEHPDQITETPDHTGHTQLIIHHKGNQPADTRRPGVSTRERSATPTTPHQPQDPDP